MSDPKYITYESLYDGRITRIMLNREKSRNAQNRGLLVELNDAFLRAEADDQVRVVILGGAGPIFSAGHDLGSKRSDRRADTGTGSTPLQHDEWRYPGGHGEANASGVALLLRTRCVGEICGRSPLPRCKAACMQQDLC